jgi:hypothetical protein
MSEDKNMVMNDQAVGAVMMALQKSLMNRQTLYRFLEFQI